MNTIAKCVVLLTVVFTTSVFSQEEKPKVALVLSGGGAKGLAHIPTLQVLDSLNIAPDLVVGNSMGSVVGALYAMGYSGDSIANISKQVNWDELLGGLVSLANVGVEEKSEFNRYLLNLDWKKGKLTPQSYLLNDQNLRALIGSLTYPVYDVTDFDELQIPFRAIATDIVNGEEVILEEGSLADAVRASMSIPVVFSPVPYKETLLVDGGILNNFPVDVAKNLEADIIIGSDVSGGLASKEELNSIKALLGQTSMLSSKYKNTANRELCTILIDHVPNLTYATEDFLKNIEIYEQGKAGVSTQKEALVALANELKNFEQRKHELPKVEEYIVLDTVVYKHISKTNLAMVKARTNIQTHKKYTREAIVEGINRTMGTTIFSQITVNPFKDREKEGLQINAFERSQNQINLSPHYDNNNGVGVVLNYSGRNILGNASRSLASIDVAEAPKFRLQHQKNFGSHRNWWWRSEVLGQRLEQTIYINGENTDKLKHESYDFENQINLNINPLRSYVGIGINYRDTDFKPKVAPELSTNVLKLSSYDYKYLEINGHYSYNSLNDVFFATKGSAYRIDIDRSLRNRVNLRFSDVNMLPIEGETNGFNRFRASYEKRLPVSKETVGIIGAGIGFIFEDSDSNISFSEYGIAGKYTLGGDIIEPANDSYVFSGLKSGELNLNHFAMLNLGLQMKLANKIYLTPHINVASVGFGSFKDYIEDVYAPDGDWQDAIATSLLVSAGATASYNSIIGPINFDVSWVNNTNKVRFLIGIGFPFNRSN